MNSPRARWSRPFTLPSGVVGDLGDLLVAQTLGVAQHEHDPVLGREPAQLALQALDPLAHLQAVGGLAATELWSSCRASRGPPARARLRPRWSSAALCVIRSSHERNGASPRKWCRRWNARRKASWLTSSASSGADDPRRHAHDDGPMALDELLERAQLPARRALDELGIADCAGGSRAGCALTTALTAEAAPGLHRFPRGDLCLTSGRRALFGAALDLETHR